MAGFYVSVFAVWKDPKLILPTIFCVTVDHEPISPCSFTIYLHCLSNCILTCTVHGCHLDQCTTKLTHYIQFYLRNCKATTTTKDNHNNSQWNRTLLATYWVRWTKSKYNFLFVRRCFLVWTIPFNLWLCRSCCCWSFIYCSAISRLLSPISPTSYCSI